MMTSTAPYYQSLRNSSYQNGSPSNAAYGAAEEDYNLAASAAPHAPMYANAAHAANGLDGFHAHSPQGIPEQHLDGAESLAGLLEAVTSAAGQEQASRSQFSDARRGGRVTRNSQMETRRQTNGQLNSGGERTKRKRSATPDHSGKYGGEEYVVAEPNHDGAQVSRRKRRKRTANNDSDQDDSFPFHDTFPPALSDARAAGVHSAAALFRQPSSNSKKYTRPPMSKLFTSLQLSPENFLHLQAAAKTYMLDPEHPERQNCVGNRGKGDTDMVKLRLFNCVRDFLSDGVGDQYFGEHADPPGENFGEAVVRKWLWPRDGSKIISLVTPLMRRMVTNERQRVYAIETRKGGSAPKKAKVSNGDGTEAQSAYMPVMSITEDYSQSPTQNHIQLPTSFPDTDALDPALQSVDFVSDCVLRVYFVKDNVLVHDFDEIPVAATYSFNFEDLESQVRGELNRMAELNMSSANGVESGNSNGNGNSNGSGIAKENTDGESSHNNGGLPFRRPTPEGLNYEIMMHSPRGLVPVRNQRDWALLQDDLTNNVWFGGIVKVIVKIS